MNNWNFTGNLGKDAESRFTPEGTAVANFSVAVKSGYGKNESTVWARCALWGKQAEAVSPYLKKGTQVGITGELSVREYESSGEKHQSLEVRVATITLLGGKPKEAPRQEKGGGFEDDIPF